MKEMSFVDFKEKVACPQKKTLFLRTSHVRHNLLLTLTQLERLFKL